jgi:hypothetical protein
VTKAHICSLGKASNSYYGGKELGSNGVRDDRQYWSKQQTAPSLAGVAPAALDRVLHRCLEKDPDNRWQTARDLKAELEWIAAGSAVAPRVIPRRALFPWIAGAAGAGAACGGA